jgi:uncharacterized protein YceK
MVIRTRLLLVLVTLMVCSLVVAGCTSVNANKDQKIVTTTTSTNNDQTFIETVQSAGADLNPIIDDIGPAMSAKDYLTVQTLGTKLSTRAQFWYDKISPMPVSSQYQDQKSTYLQALLNKKATGDEWTTEAQNSGKVTTTSPTYQSTNDDRTFIVAYNSALLDMLCPDLTTAEDQNDYPTVVTLSMKLSTRAQFWYDKITPMQVSSKYQVSKSAYLQALSEEKASYDALTKGTQLYQAGQVSAATDVFNQVVQHMNKAIDYINLAKDNYPSSQSTNDNQKVVYQQTVAVQTTLQSANDDIKFLITIKDATHELGPIATAAGTALNSNDLSTAKTLGAKLSTRSQYWYNEVAPLSVSSKYQEPKDALCIYLSEQKAGGDSWVEMIQLLQDGKVSASNDKANEGLQHLKKATIYINLATAELST